jgi:ornithine--oxo-acid transaminase
MDARLGQVFNGQAAIALERAYAAPNYAPIPVTLERGDGCWLWDADGKRYLDFMSAYSAVSHGHAHPRLVQALIDQAQRVAVTSRAYHSTVLGPFLAKLVELTDLASPTRALPASGGCESVETAIKAARRWGYRVKGIPADQAEIVVARGNFHGRSSTVVGFSTEPAYRSDFGPFAPGFRHFDFGDIASLDAAITDATCAVLIEPIQGEAGIVLPPAGFLQAARRLCDERRALLILDEIQSGLGRTGKTFACEWEGVKPDLFILGKALGGGIMPMSAVVSTKDILGVFKPGDHGSTFGGNPLACAVGRHAIKILASGELQKNAQEKGSYILEKLRAQKFPKIQQIRGRGLWLAIEIKKEAGRARPFCERLMQEGLLCKETHEQSIRLAPPLVISKDECDWALERLIRVLA